MIKPPLTLPFMILRPLLANYKYLLLWIITFLPNLCLYLLPLKLRV